MNRFLRRIFWFVLPVAAAAAGAEWGLRCIPHQLGYKAAYMERHAPEIEVLSLGLSHAFYGLDFHASKFRGFNLAYHGQPLDRAWIDWKEVADGAGIDFSTAAKPSGKWGREVLPPSYE